MDNHQKNRMTRTLLDGGMPAWRVERTVDELADHYLDVQEEALAAGLSVTAANAEACSRMGELNVIADRLLADQELCDWPLLAGIENHAYAAEAALVKRWCLAIACSAFGTATLLLMLHVIIVIN